MPEEAAIKAAEALADNQNATNADVQDLQLELAKLDKALAVVKWVSFATFAIVAASMVKSLLAI